MSIYTLIDGTSASVLDNPSPISRITHTALKLTRGG